MPDVREIVVQWNLPNGLVGAMVTHWSPGPATPEVQCEALAGMLSVLDSNLVPGLSWVVPAEGRQIDVATGTLTGPWTSDAPITGAGGAAGQQVPDVAQVLLRWRTAAIRRGRFLQGRSYIPALNEGYVASGNVASALRVTWEAAQSALVTAGVGYGVYGRPLPARGGFPPAPGVFALATSGAVWGELAVQRGRRG